MKTNRKLTELNANILKIAGRVSKAIEEETEEVLEHAEQAVRHYVPARFVKRTLAALRISWMMKVLRLNLTSE
jgi:hypothetical protein